MSPDTLLNVQEVADFLQMNAATIYNWAQEGRIPAIKLGRSWRFRRADLEKWLDANSPGLKQTQDRAQDASLYAERL